MIFRILLWPTLILLLTMSSALAQSNSYLCVAENAVGFSFNKSKNQWEQTSFKDERKYLLSKSNDKTKGWEIKRIGESIGIECPGGFDEAGFIECKELMEFQMNNQSLRYIIVFKYGYVVKEYSDEGVFKEGSLTPYLEIGKCSPL